MESGERGRRGRGDRGGFRGRGDGRGGGFRGRGDFRGGGSGRDGGFGRGDGGRRGRPQFDTGPAERIGPAGEAQPGTAGRPGTEHTLPGANEMEQILEANISGITQALRSLSLNKPKPQPPGRLGRAIKLKANHFRVACNLTKATHFDITVLALRRGPPSARGAAEGDSSLPGPPLGPPGPQRPIPASICRKVIVALAEQENWPEHKWVFDGQKALYVAGGTGGTSFLPQHETVYEVEANDGESARPRAFRVTIKFAALVNIQALVDFVRTGGGQTFPQEAIQCLDSVLRSSMSLRPDVATFARGFFLSDSQFCSPIGSGAEVCQGYMQSLRPEQLGLALQVDMAVTAFLEPGPVIDYLQRAAGLRDPRDFARATPIQLRKANKAIIGIKVEVRRDGTVCRRYKAKGLTDKGPRDLVFHNEQEQRDMTVLEYFESQYNIKLRYPEVPCVNAGTPRKPVWLPPELLTVAKGQRRLKLDERQTAEIIKTAAKKPADRMGWIEACVNQHANLPQDPTLAAFQMRVEGRMVDIRGRHLPPPGLLYGGKQVVSPEPEKGAWNAQHAKFFQAALLTSFGVASFVAQQKAGGPVEDPSSINAFFMDQLTGCRNNGMQLPQGIDPRRGLPPELVVYADTRSEFVGETLGRAYKTGGNYFKKTPLIIFVILPERGTTDAYKEVKRASDSYLGVPSQCLNPAKASIGMPLRRSRGQYCGNVAMKINAKINGINHKLRAPPFPWMKQPYIVIGADVTHPVGFASSIPSVAAVVASLDSSMGRFASRIMLQAHRQEILVNLKDVVKELLTEFVRANGGTKPARILFFRDGVSEGQFQQVQEKEIPQISAAIVELQQTESAMIPLTYIICQKRHMTRLFPGERAASDRNGNVLPGTVVDADITDLRHFNFFLNSHASIQGTSRPARYFVLLDQNNMGPDEIQQFSYWSCYTFARCTRAVSLPPPIYYAHLAAFRGRVLVADVESDLESVRTGGSEGPVRVEYAEVNKNLHSRMFFI